MTPTGAQRPTHPTIRLAAGVVLAAAAVVGLVLLVNLGLTLALFGPREGVDRVVGDWRRIQVARSLGAGALSPAQAYRQVYGETIGPNPRPQDVRAWLWRDLEAGEPIVWDAVLARYLVDRFGAVDGRSVPPGVYLAAGPIGPDRWPGPILTHYGVFPRHGYILVVPVPDAGRVRPAVEATASLRRDFRPGGDGDSIFAVVSDYAPGAFDFPTPGEPVHDLFLLSTDPQDIRTVEQRLRTAAATLNGAELGYGLLSRNSNSALSCFLTISGLPQARLEAVRRPFLTRLRLPGVRQPLWRSEGPEALAACAEGG